MKILALRILPPIAIGRLGASPTPQEAYELHLHHDRPMDYRKVVPMESFEVDPSTGKLKSFHPKSVHFKDAKSIRDKQGKIRPVAPFLEVFAITDAQPDVLVPLTLDLLSQAGYSLDDLSWNVEVGNIKVFRRTGDENDKVYARINGLQSHASQDLLGECNNFLKGKTIPLGKVQYIAPSPDHPGIRLRYTPAAGLVYGSSLTRYTGTKEEPDPVITDEAKVIYDTKKGKWKGYSESANYNPLYTNPAQIFAGYSDAQGNQVSWGYLDDECDGFAEVVLKGHGSSLSAKAHISAGPPAFAPDSLPIRVVSDELEQILLGPEVEGDVPIDEAEEMVRRSLETIRLMNTAVMNGNPINGRLNVVSTMVRQNTNDFSRYYGPMMATSLVDNTALRALHERVFNGLATGAAAWFGDALRRPEDIGDLSDEGLRQMPGLMRGADGRMLTLTRRNINLVIAAAANAMFAKPEGEIDNSKKAGPLLVDDLTAQLHYRGEGNPYSVLPRTAISNCFPGLEFDFRNFWRRAFAGIVLIENNNYVIDADPEYQHLVHTRLVAIDGKPTAVPTTGPTFPNGSSVALPTPDNPNAVSFMEWSNNMVYVLQKQGQMVELVFTKEASPTQVVPSKPDIDNGYSNKQLYQKHSLRVNKMFEPGTATPSSEVVRPGELTQGLCAPWQNDYRECACYYWAATRPDYVNVVNGEDGLSQGDNWLSKHRTGEYVPDNRTDSRLVSYDDLFENWQGELNFLIRGNDALEGG